MSGMGSGIGNSGGSGIGSSIGSSIGICWGSDRGAYLIVSKGPSLWLAGMVLVRFGNELFMGMSVSVGITSSRSSNTVETLN